MLKDKIQEDLKDFLKAKKEIETSVSRMLLASLSNKETEKRTKIWKAKPELKTEDLEKESQLTDEETIETISSEIKKRREAINLYEKGGRQELADKEKKEIEVLREYLPEQLSEDEIKKLVAEAVSKTGAKDIKEMGKVMGILTPQIKGKADMGSISKLVKESLS